MKNTTLYTLLCTTILIPTICFAAEKKEPQTPTKQIAQLERERDALPATPQIKDTVTSNYAGKFPPSAMPYVVDSAVQAARTDRDLKKDVIDSKIEALQTKRQIEVSKQKAKEAVAPSIQRSYQKMDHIRQSGEQEKLRAESLARELEETRSACSLAEKQYAEMVAQHEQAKKEAEEAKKATEGTTSALIEQSTQIQKMAEAVEARRREAKNLKERVNELEEALAVQSVEDQQRKEFMQSSDLMTPASAKGGTSSGTSVRRALNVAPEDSVKRETQAPASVTKTPATKSAATKKKLEDDADF